MKRAILLLVMILSLAAEAGAQIGKNIMVKAGSPEDRLLQKITVEEDTTKRLALLDDFVKEFGSTETVLLAYEIYQTTYLRMKEYDRAIEYGEKALAIDSEDAPVIANLVRAAQEKGDTEKLIGYAERLGQLFTRVRTMPAPQSMSPEDWARSREEWLATVKSDVEYAEYTMFTSAAEEKDAARKINYLDRFGASYPNSAFLPQLPVQQAFAYQQKGDLDKMNEYADKVLAGDPNNLAVLLLVADALSERGADLMKATNYAKKVLEIVGSGAGKPEQLTDEQWAERRKVSEGLAHSVLGQVYLRQNKTQAALAEYRAASPLLKSDSFSYARNLYRLGFLYARLNQLDQARTILTEAVSIPGPYQAPTQEVLDKVNRARAGRR